MRTFNKQAASLKKNLKQNNLMPLFVVFSVIVMLSLTYKSVSKVNGVGNTMFKEGNRNRRRRVRQGFREGNDHGEAEQFDDIEGGQFDDKEEAMTGDADGAPEGFLNGGGIGMKASWVEGFNKKKIARKANKVKNKVRNKIRGKRVRQDKKVKQAELGALRRRSAAAEPIRKRN